VAAAPPGAVQGASSLSAPLPEASSDSVIIASLVKREKLAMMGVIASLAALIRAIRLHLRHPPGVS